LRAKRGNRNDDAASAMTMSFQIGKPPLHHGIGASCVGLPTGNWPTVLEYLVQRFPAIKREVWQQRMVQGEVISELGTVISPDQVFTPGQRVYYYRSVPNEAAIPFEEVVLFEDEQLVVVDKPHFLPVVPSGGYLNETVLVRLKCKLGLDDLVPIHRIDRDTAGLVLFCKRPRDRAAYAALFRKHDVNKTYQAIAPWCADLKLPLTRASRIVESGHFMLQKEVAGAPNALTHIDVIEVQGERARYELKPVTGKRHQLRVHMAALGLPIVGDGLYPTLTPEGQIDYARPLQLLAQQIEFVDPVTLQQRQFESQRRLHFG